jgi:hypothetical protein
MVVFGKLRIEHQHELRLSVVFGLFSFPFGYLTASLVTADRALASGLAEILSAMIVGTVGLIFGSMLGARMDRASENSAHRKRYKPSFIGR